MTATDRPKSGVPASQVVPGCPYVGLVPFDQATMAFFFGRADETEIIAANVVASRVTLLYAPSGVGKTSILRAGVLPQLRDRTAGDRELEIPSAAIVYVSEWRDRPIDVVAAKIREALREIGIVVDAPTADASLSEWLVTVFSQFRLPAVYLIFDQFEEYYIHHPEDEALTTEIGEILGAREVNVHVLFSLRADALAGLDRFEGIIPHLFENYVRLSYLTRDAARTAIEGPLQRYNELVPPDRRVDIQPELVELLLNQVQAGRVVVGRDEQLSGGPDVAGRSEIETPYLQLVLTRLWEEEHLRDSRLMRVETLNDLGGAQTIVQSHLDEVMADLSEEHADAAAAVFQHMVTRTGAKQALADPDLAEMTGLPAERIRNLLEHLSAGPRRVLRPVPPAGGVDGPPRFEIFHDVMGKAVLDWRQLRLERQQGLKRERELEAAREAERETRRRLRRARLVVLGVSLLLGVTFVLGVLFFTASREAEANSRLAWSRQLASQADQWVGTRPDAAVLVGLQSLSLARDSGAVPPPALIAGLANTTHASRRIENEAQVDAAVYSPDGTLLATAGADSVVRLWEVADGRPHGPSLRGHTDAVWGVAFSPDGTLVATAGSDATVRLWEVATGRPRGDPLVGHRGAVWGVAFSSDGRFLASAGDDTTVRLWEVATGRPYGEPLPHPGRVWDVAFSPDAAVVASGGDDGAVRLWEVASGRPRGQPLTQPGRVLAVAFGADGAVVATGGDDGRVRLWDAATGQLRGRPLDGHSGAVWGVAFSRGGAVLASSGDDRTVRLWDAVTGAPLGLPLTGHASTVWSVAFSPDDASVASASSDSTVRLWTVAEDGSFSRPLTGHTDGVNGVAFGPDGALIATASSDATVRLWDAATGRLHGSPLVGHTGWVGGVAFSPDGAVLATARRRRPGAVVGCGDRPAPRAAAGRSHRGRAVGGVQPGRGRCWPAAATTPTVRLWDVATGQPHGSPLPAHLRCVECGVQPGRHPAGHASNEQTVRLWDVATGRLHGQPLRGHSNAVRGVAVQPGRRAAGHRVERRDGATVGRRHRPAPRVTPDRHDQHRDGRGVQPGRSRAGHRLQRRDRPAVGRGHRRSPRATPDRSHRRRCGGWRSARTAPGWPP